jgi:SAM-dependent methyltransferase
MLRAVRFERSADMIEDLPEPREDLHNVRPGCRGTGLGRRKNQLAALERYGLRPSSQVLEVGCGVGWLAFDLASRLTEAGAYAGLDVSDVTIAWLNQNYASRLPNFRFDLLDVKNGMYRPRGRQRAERAQFPYEDDEFDVACAFNVLMYLTDRGIANYLREIARVLRDGGVGVLTLKAIIGGDLGPTGTRHRYVGKGVYAPQSGWAMAYDDTLIRSLIDKAGLETCAFEIGAWHKQESLRKSEGAAASNQPGPDLYVVRHTLGA